MECITIHYGQISGRPLVFKDRDLIYLPTIVYGIRFTFSRSDIRCICNSSVQCSSTFMEEVSNLMKQICSYVPRESYRGPRYCQCEGHYLQVGTLLEARFYTLKLVYIIFTIGNGLAVY